jgi:hypothetical protein
MAKTVEWDGVRGVWEETIDDSQTGGLIIHTKQDVQPALDWARKQRNHGHNDLGGRRDGNDLKHYALIPATTIVELRNKGLDIWNKNQTNEIIREIETNYPLCKVTNRKLL